MRRWSFRRRQFFTLLALSIVPLAVMLGTFLPYSRSFVIQQATMQLETVADLKTAQVQQWFDRGRELALLVAVQRPIRHKLPLLLDPSDVESGALARADLYVELGAISAIFPGVRSVSLLHPVDGQVLLSTDRVQEGRMRGKEDYFLAGRQTLYVSPVTYSVGRESPILVVSVPLLDEDRRLLAVVAVEMDLADLGTKLDHRAGLGESGQAYLVEGYGFYVTLPPKVKGSPLRTIARSKGVSRALAGQDGSDTYLDPGDHRVLGVYRWLPEVQLGLLVEMEESELTARIMRTWVLIIVVSLGVLLVAIFSARRLSHWLVTPLDQITNAARVLRGGNLSHRAPAGGPDEIGQLADSFNEMADGLQLYSENLEQLVAHRTAELQIANEELGWEIAERWRVEEQLRASLAAQEMLLQEIHHRVKNNLQVVSALLGFQAETVEDERSIEAFQESQNRIQAMASIHEQLYRSQDLAQIEMEGYIWDLAVALRHSYGAYAVDLKVDAPGVAMGIDMAIPCGLIVNELVSNAMKHAFQSPGGIGVDTGLPGSQERDPDRQGAQIGVELRSLNEGESGFELVVWDNGAGMPEGWDLENSITLGLRLVSMLTRQLRGTLQADRQADRSEGAGMVFYITFPASIRRD